MSIQVGDTLPAGTFMTMTADGPRPMTTDEVFKGKTAVLFAVPGAFTPTCSAKHVPSYVTQADALKAKGVDLVACLSVNDAFVLGAWCKDQQADGKVLMLADGNGDYVTKLGLQLDASGFGMGTRAKRFALVAKDGQVTVLHVEENPGVMEVSSAEAILAKL